MSRIITERVLEYFDDFTTEHPISGHNAYMYMLEVMYDDPVVMEEFAIAFLEQADWVEIARSVNHDTGCS